MHSPNFFLRASELFPQLSKFDLQVRQASHGLLLAETLAMGQGGNAAVNLRRRDVVGDAAGAGDHGAVADADVVADGRLAAQHDPAPSFTMPARPTWPVDNAVRADLHVVADLNEIVDLCPAANARGAELRAIDARTGADLDIVFDDDVADLRESWRGCWPSQR